MGRQGRAVTSQQMERLLEGLRHGMTRRAAAAYAGFTKQTLYRHIDRDVTLLTAIEKAEGEAEAAFTKIVADAAVKNWTAAAWWMERRHPDDYGRRDRLDVRVDMRTIAAKVAAEQGLDESEVMAEVDRIMAEAR